MGKEPAMNDCDADEVISQRKVAERTPLIDKALGVTGVTLAAVATFFPWYAFFHQDTFTMPAPWQGATRDLPEKIGSGTVVAVSPLALPESSPEMEAAVDQLTTATIPAPVEDAGVAPQDDLEQPFPFSTGFRLMHVANGRALIEDASGMYIVRVGSVLPDNSRLATLEERDGRWVMITSTGTVYETN